MPPYLTPFQIFENYKTANPQKCKGKSTTEICKLAGLSDEQIKELKKTNYTLFNFHDKNISTDQDFSMTEIFGGSFSVTTESKKDDDLSLIEYNGQKYKKILNDGSKVIGETKDGEKYVLQETLGDKINNYFYNEKGYVIDIKIRDKKGNELPLNYEGTRREQYTKFLNDVKDEYICNDGVYTYTKNKIPGYRVGQKEDIDNINSDDSDILKDAGLLDKHGNVVRFGGEVQKSGTYVPTQNDRKNLKYVFGQTQYANNFRDHAQMLDAIDYAKENGVPLKGITVLINCDTHSDVYLGTNTIRANRANWVNACLAQNPNITDFYWVVSENMIKDKEIGAILSGKQIKNSGGDRSKALLQNVDTKADLKCEESIRTYYIDNAGNISTQKTESARRPIRIHICTEKNLPDFQGKKVMSTFDMDYFSNSGFDTITDYRDNKTSEELNSAFSQMLQTFADHHIQPIMHGNCYSSEDEDGFYGYLPNEDLKQVKEFSNAIISITPQKTDKLDDYKHGQ